MVPAAAPPSPGVFLAPGWIDLQVNGFAGVDYNRPDTPLEEIGRSIRVLHSTGVTALLSHRHYRGAAAMTASLANLAHAAESLPEGWAMAGIHVEGPHICAEDGPRGAHPRRGSALPISTNSAAGRMLPATASGWLPWRRMAGRAPLYRAHYRRGSGCRHRTYPGYRRPDLRRRIGRRFALYAPRQRLPHGPPAHPNYIWEQFAEDRLRAGFIVDGIHLDQAFLKVALRAKGIDRAVLVTDASPPAASPPGRYTLGEQEVDLTADGHVVLAGSDRLAGSALRMDRAIANPIRFTGIPLADAVRMATVNPARAGAFSPETATLAPGAPADLVQLRWDPAHPAVEIISTWLAGRHVYP